jgi:endoglucanase
MKTKFALSVLGLVALSVALGQGNVGTVKHLTLVDADRDEAIAGFDPMKNGATLNLNKLPTPLLSIEAVTEGTVGSVRFELNGQVVRTDNGNPFAIAGDTGGDYREWTPRPGEYTLRATPFAQPDAQGAAGTPLTLEFKVTQINPSDNAANITDPAEWQLPTYIMVDQFGYRPGDTKVAVLTDPQVGKNAADAYTPGETLEVRRVSDDKVMLSGKPTPWNDLAVQPTSGDRGWWFDFSSLNEPGSYYVFDAARGVKSFAFEINRDVYTKLLKTAMRMFYYNRANAAKKAPFADPRWTDEVSFVGPGQDGEARSVSAKNDPSTARDLTGGWWDAGDQNKYVTFAMNPVHVLMTAYEQTPQAFTDDYNIPESGNGLPDVLDETKRELEWIAKMQFDDGGIAIKMGYIDYNTKFPPSKDTRPRYYGPKCSSSSIDGASMFAHGAVVFGKIAAYKSFAADLQARALRAWDWYEKNPKRDDCDDGEIKSGDADRSPRQQRASAAVAAAYLFALTGDKRFDEGVRLNMDATRAMSEDRWSVYDAEQGDALLFYAALPNANPAVSKLIVERKVGQAKRLEFYSFKPELDLYRAFMRTDSYHWGSNMMRMGFGATNMDLVHHKLDLPNQSAYRVRALEMLHYVHGVNPLGLVYLSNMKDDGAERSVNTIWHDWFKPGSKYGSSKDNVGPPPGYLTGGPNKGYTGSFELVKDQPSQKSYVDTNDGNKDGKGQPWELVEPAIYYQAAYVRLLANFVNNDIAARLP